MNTDQWEPCSDSFCRTFAGHNIALKVASLGSWKQRSLEREYRFLMAVSRLWGQCVPSVELAGPLVQHGHGYGLGTSLLSGSHPKQGDLVLVYMSKAGFSL